MDYTEEDDSDHSDDEDESEDNDDSDYMNQSDILEQLQSALFAGGGGALNPETIARLRTQLAGNIFLSGTGGQASATHTPQIRSILASLPSNIPATDPMILYTCFTELWELIVLTGEEVEDYEFDGLVDLKPLLPHLLRVLKWEDDCQVYGTEFLLYAIRCTRACIQYSPASCKRFVDCGLIPLLINQLRSVEYIDLAEDLIQIMLLLSAKPAFAKNCLHAGGIEAVLGFVDFLALSVQVNAFSAAAQMTVALTDETFALYMTSQTLQLLQQTLKRYSESDQGTLKLVHSSAQSILNTLQAAPKHSQLVCPGDLVISTIFPMATVLPLDSASIVLKLLDTDTATADTFKNDNSPAILEFFNELLKTGGANEKLLSVALKIMAELFCSAAQSHIQSLLKFNLKTRATHQFNIEATAFANILLEFYLNSPSISTASRHSCLLVLLLLDDTLSTASSSLVKIGAISRLLSVSNYSKDPLTLIVGLEWCRVLSCKSASSADQFSSTAVRQGLPLELTSLASHLSSTMPSVKIVSEELRKWLEDRLTAFNVTLFSGDEPDLFKIYTKHLVTAIQTEVTVDKTSNEVSAESNSTTRLNLAQFLQMIKDQASSFTEFEWLGDPESCLARQLLDLLTSSSSSSSADTLVDPCLFEPVVDSIHDAMARYDSSFTLNLPTSAILSRSTNPLEALALFSRPIRLKICIPATATEKLIMCDLTPTIGWLVKMAECGEAERKILLQEYDALGMEQAGSVSERIQDALQERNISSMISMLFIFLFLSSESTTVSASVANFSSTAFTNKRVTLKLIDKHNRSKNMTLQPAQSLMQVLFAHLCSEFREGEDPWKHINDLWSYSLTITIESGDTELCDDDDDMQTSRDDRISLALELLAKIPLKLANENLSAKLSKELNSPFLVAVQRISRHWITAAQSHPFLFPFELRFALMRAVFLGRLRALWILQQHSTSIAPSAAAELNSSVSLPRRKFKVHRGSAEFLKCLRNVLAPVNCGDFRLFEFEYADELGTGHGPTMEFYALASTEITRPSLGLFHVTRTTNLDADEIVEAEGEGLFPAWTRRECNVEGFRLLGALVARAWLDDRIIDIPLHPLFVELLKSARDSDITIDDLRAIDSELHAVLTNGSLIDSGIGFMVPGTEIVLGTDGSRLITNSVDVEEFQRLLMQKINQNLKLARESFLKGFNDSFPSSFAESVSFFPLEDLLRLFSSSASSSASPDWSITSISSSLIPDHGYRPDSPQIRWLAEIMAETESFGAKVKLIRFLTGAAYLPVGGWKALRPPLTIVCKTFSDSESTASVNNSATSPTVSTVSTTSSTNSENHDIYLPSVMTCANYLKLPRYSSKEVMRERLQYAIKEGCGSFYLS